MTDIFDGAISTSIDSMFSKAGGAVTLPSGISNTAGVQTNSFYGNLLCGSQDCAVWTHPYSVYQSVETYYGLQVYYAQESDRVFASGTVPLYFYSPTGIKELVLSAADFKSKTTFTVNSMTKFSATPRFTASNGGYLDTPLVQGMGFVTGVYHNLTPQIYSAVGFKSVTGVATPRSGINKYRIVLNNGTTWTMYITIPSDLSLSLKLKDQYTIISSNSISGGVIQLCFGTSSVYDSAAGCYPTGASISALVTGDSCSYSLKYTVKGSSNKGTTLLFALPHHRHTMSSATQAKRTSFSLLSTTGGQMVGYLTNTLTMTDKIYTGVGFGPYTTIPGKKANYTSNALAAITTAAKSEVTDDVVAMTNSTSMYTSGKILSKYAMVLYTTHFILKNTSLTNVLLPKMKSAIERFSKNTQTYPLIYDTTCKGVVTTATADLDYGANYYNDHHFHYGYHIHAAAVTAKVDSDLGGTWINSVRTWVNTLVRDVANPSTSDTYFPVFRSFDFFHGHSWAKGMYASADGKDEESTSEDVHFAYAMKLWGQVSGNSNMEKRGDLMIALLRRSLDFYFLYKDDNTTEPSLFTPNKCSGILFENKIDHTTYFGTLTQYIHGIQMLPITAASSVTRYPLFVQEEWKQKLASIIDGITDGWKGILMLNVALYDPTTAYKFFTSSSFSSNYLDNGMSKTWSIAYCAGVGASS